MSAKDWHTQYADAVMRERTDKQADACDDIEGAAYWHARYAEAVMGSRLGRHNGNQEGDE